MRKFQISFYTDTYLPAIDGVSTSIHDFKRELELRGNIVKLLTSGNSKTKRYLKKSKNILVTPSVKFPKYPQYNLSILPFIDVGRRWAANSDIVHIHTPFTIGLYGLMSGYVNHTPVVWTFHTLFTNKDTISQYGPTNKSLKRLIKKYLWSYIRFIAKRCDVVIAPSETIKKLLNHKGIMNVVVVPNGVNLKKFKKENKRSKILRKKLIGNKKYLVLYVGRISKEKNIDTLIKAAKVLKNKNIKFIFVGDGPYIEVAKSMVKRMKLENIIEFTGMINKSLLLYYNAADLLCLPSTFETQGIVSLEAMACNKPVVGADYLALKEIIHNGKNGEKFKPKDYKACARKIEKVINNLCLYKEMRITVQKYSIEKSTDKLLGVYTKLISKRTGSRLLRFKR